MAAYSGQSPMTLYTICCPISPNSRVPLSRVNRTEKNEVGGKKLFPISQENGRVGRAIRVPHQTRRRMQREPYRSTRVYRPSMALRSPRWTVLSWTRRRTSQIKWRRGTPWTVRRWTRRRAWCCLARRIAARGSLLRERPSCSWLRRSYRARPGMSC